MKRISIEVTEQQQQRLKAMAALQGKSIKEFVLASTIGTAESPTDEAKALMDLELLLRQRAAEVAAGRRSKRTVEDIFQAGIDKGAGEPNA
mgnify:CR=1 FL=1